MNYRSWCTTSMVAFIAALIATGPAMSDDQLRAQVKGQLAEHKVTIANFDNLSDNQISQINLILSAPGSDTQYQALIENLLVKDAACVGNDQLRQNVSNQLKEHKIEVKNFDKISGSELVVIKTILDSTEPNNTKEAQIARIFAVVTPVKAGDYLREDAQRCIDSVKADVNLENLTPDQMLQIQLIASGTEDANTKRAKIEKIANQ